MPTDLSVLKEYLRVCSPAASAAPADFLVDGYRIFLEKFAKAIVPSRDPSDVRYTHTQHTYTHTHIHTYTRTHTYTHTHTHAHTLCTYTRTHTHLLTHTPFPSLSPSFIPPPSRNRSCLLLPSRAAL